LQSSSDSSENGDNRIPGDTLLVYTPSKANEIDVVWQNHKQQPMEKLQMENYFSYPIRGRLP